MDLFGFDIRTPYGWGIIQNKVNHPTDSVAVKLDWGILYAPIATLSNLKRSSTDIGSCALTATGSCIILDYHRTSDCYKGLFFASEKDTNGVEVTKYRTETFAAVNFIKSLPVCAGLTVSCEGHGVGTVITYHDQEDMFEVRFTAGIELIESSVLTNSFPVNNVYATASYILENYVLEQAANNQPVTSPNSTTESKTAQSSSLIIKTQIQSFQKLLTTCNERITELTLRAGAVKGDNVGDMKQAELQKIGDLMRSMSDSLKDMTAEHKKEAKPSTDSTTAVVSATGTAITANTNTNANTLNVDELKDDFDSMMRYFDKFSDLMSTEFDNAVALMKEVAEADPILSEMMNKLKAAHELVTGKLASLQSTKSYNAYTAAKEHFSKRLDNILAGSSGKFDGVSESLKLKMTTFMSTTGSQLLAKQGGNFLQQCKDSPHAKMLMDTLFQQSCDEVLSSESDIKRNMNRLDVLLNSAQSSFEGNSSSIVSVMVVTMLDLDASMTSQLGNSMSDMLSSENGALKHALCLKLCEILLVLSEKAESTSGRKLSGNEILRGFRETPMQSMMGMFQIYGTKFRQEKDKIMNDGSMMGQMLSMGSSVLDEHPEVGESLQRLTIAAMSMARGASNQSALMSAEQALGSVREALDSELAEEAMSKLVSHGDRFLTAVENMRDNEYIQQVMSHVSDGDLDPDSLLNAALAKASNLDVNSMFTKVSELMTDKDARNKLVDMWKDDFLDFLIGFLPTLTIPDIDGIKDDLQYHISGLDMSGIKLKKDEVTITLVDSPFASIGVQVDEISDSSVVTAGVGGQPPTLELFKMHVGGISALFNDVEWSYLQLFFPHLHGDGLASASITNASLDMGFKLIRVPKGVIQTLASDPEGPFQSSKLLWDTYSHTKVRTQLDNLVKSKLNVSADTEEQLKLASYEYCDWGEVVEWEPALVVTGGGAQKMFTIAKLQLITDQQNALLAWLYNQFAILFERTIKDYVCISVMEMLEGNAAEMLTTINSSLANYFPMISQVLKITVNKIPKATVEDLYRLVGPDPNLDGYSAGPKRVYTIKFPEPGPLGVKLDIVSVAGSAASSIKSSSSGHSSTKSVKEDKDAVSIKAIITGAKEGSQAERAFMNVTGIVPQDLTSSTLVSVNGVKVAGMSEQDILSTLKVAKRPLTIIVSIHEDVYASLRTQHALNVTKRRKDPNSNSSSSKSGSKVTSPSPSARAPIAQKAAPVAASSASHTNRRKLKAIRATFQAGPLGLKLKETKSCGGAVIITGFAREKDTDALLQAELLGVLEAGMIMLAVEKEIVFGQPFDVVMNVIKAAARPLNILFVNSPDIQVVLPSPIHTVRPTELVLGMIEGFVMITANNMKKQLQLACSEHKEDGNVNCDKLLPGMVILQVNKLTVLTNDQGDGRPIDMIEQVYSMMSASAPIKLAIRDMDAFMHLIRIRDKLESIENDVTFD